MVTWKYSAQPVPYPDALTFMEQRVADIRAGEAEETVWLLEHPPLYTAGTSAKPQDLRSPNRFPVYQTGRGGQFTYHGPGQRVAYVMLNLRERGPDLRAFVCSLEGWAIDTLAQFGIAGERREGRVGIWVDRGDGREDKIAAIGVRVRHWVTYHGIAINLNPTLEHFSGIVPCGIADPKLGVTSLHDLGISITAYDLDRVLQRTFGLRFPAKKTENPRKDDVEHSSV